MPENSVTNKKELSADDMKMLQSYIHHADLLTESEPEYNMTDQESADEWNEWNEKFIALNAKYHDVIVKALTIQLSGLDVNDDPQAVIEILRFLLPDKNPPAEPKPGLLSANAFLPLLNNAVTNEFSRLNLQNLKYDEISNKATVTVNKVTFEISNSDDLRGSGGSSAKKLLDTGVAYLTDVNYGHNADRFKVLIPLIEYGESRGWKLTPQQMNTPAAQTKENRQNHDRIFLFKKRVYKDLKRLAGVTYNVREISGRNKGNYIEKSLISGHGIVLQNGELMIEIDFNEETAKYLAKSYIMPFPTVLLKLDDRNPNAYPIGKKIAEQSGNDHNAVKGTENTLKVKTLLAAASEIITIESLRAKGRRDWKERIKKPLESAIKENMRVGYVIRWEYRNPKTGKTYNSDQANALSWDEWYNLDIDFTLMDNPQQNERRNRLAADKEKALNPPADNEEIPDLSETPEPM